MIINIYKHARKSLMNILICVMVMKCMCAVYICREDRETQSAGGECRAQVDRRG